MLDDMQISTTHKRFSLKDLSNIFVFTDPRTQPSGLRKTLSFISTMTTSLGRSGDGEILLHTLMTLCA